jgi:hypothetical protein
VTAIDVANVVHGLNKCTTSAIGRITMNLTNSLSRCVLVATRRRMADDFKALGANNGCFADRAS